MFRVTVALALATFSIPAVAQGTAMTFYSGGGWIFEDLGTDEYPRAVGGGRPNPHALFLTPLSHVMAGAFTCTYWDAHGGKTTVQPNGCSGRGLNNVGLAVGYTHQNGQFQQAFQWFVDSPSQARVFIPPLVGGGANLAADVNNYGWVVGASDDENGALHAFAYNNNGGWLIDLGALPSHDHSMAIGINDRGDVVGKSWTVGPATLPQVQADEASPLDDGEDVGCEPLPGIGTSPEEAFLSPSGLWNQPINLGALWPTSTGSMAQDVNEHRLVAGTIREGCVSEAAIWFVDIETHRWTAQPLGSLSSLPGHFSSNSDATAVNDLDQVVGSSITYGGERHGFLWDPVNGMRDLHHLPITSLPPGFVMRSATDISDDQTIVGTGTAADGRSHGFRLIRWSGETALE